MKLYFSLIALSLIAFGCGSPAASRQDDNTVAIAVRQLKTSVEDLRHDLNGLKVDLQILEGKVQNVETANQDMRRQTADIFQTDQESIKAKANFLEKRVDAFEKMQEGVGADIRQLKTHANETTNSLTQLKNRLNSMEQSFNEQIAKLKTAIENIMLILQPAKESTAPSNASSYRVRSGDSLEKIAKMHETSVENIKKLNNLKNDTIHPGQELKVK